jgi:DNA processing protein
LYTSQSRYILLIKTYGLCAMKTTNKTSEVKLTSKREIVLRAIHYSVAIFLVGHRVKGIREISQKASFLWDEVLTPEKFKEETHKVLGFGKDEISLAYKEVEKAFSKVDFDYEIIDVRNPDYPVLLKSLSSKPPFLFLRGDSSLFRMPIVSIVGTRNPSPEGIQRARKLAILLKEKGIVVASGLAKGIDRSAHVGALQVGGRTIAVIGTPLNVYYPKENAKLQETIAQTNLLVSQFPFSHPVREYTFPIRNYTMSGISLATVIVEAKQGSGALYQAQDALKQGRSLFIMKHLFSEPGLEWPKKFVGKPGVYVLSEVGDIIKSFSTKRGIQKEVQESFFEFTDIKVIKVGL